MNWISVHRPSYVIRINVFFAATVYVPARRLQGIGALGFAFRGTEAMVMPAFNKKIAETQCVNCGQCRVFCPTGAISIHTNI